MICVKSGAGRETDALVIRHVNVLLMFRACIPVYTVNNSNVEQART